MNVDQTIAKIAEQLGFQAARLWPQVVMVTWLTSLFWVIVEPVIVVASVVGTVLMIRKVLREVRAQRLAYEQAKATSREHVSTFDYDPMAWVLVGSAVIVALCFIGIVALVSFPDQLVGALYPEATTVLRIAKGLR